MEQSLKLSMITGAQMHTIANVDASKDFVISLRGTRSSVAGLEVSLVCVVEGEETVWEMRVKSSQSPQAPMSGTPRGPPRLIYTPPVQRQMLDKETNRFSYFATTNALSLSPKDSLKHSNSSSPKHAVHSFPLHKSVSQQMRSGAPSLKNHSPSATSGTASFPSTPKRFMSSGVVGAANVDDEDHLSSKETEPGFSRSYLALASAYRSAHIEAEGNEEAGSAIYSPTSSTLGLTSADAGNPTPRRSPENRYALYMQPANGLSSSIGSKAVESHRRSTDVVEQADWQGYTSALDQYSSSGGKSQTTSPVLSQSSLSPPSSPSALLQRRLGNRAALQDTFRLGLGVQGAEFGTPYWPLSEDMKDTTSKAGEQDLDGEAEVRSMTSARYLGKEGWSATEDEGEAPSGDDMSVMGSEC